MEVTSGRPEVAIGLIDGSVATNHPDLPRRQLGTSGLAGPRRHLQPRR